MKSILSLFFQVKIRSACRQIAQSDFSFVHTFRFVFHHTRSWLTNAQAARQSHEQRADWPVNFMLLWNTLIFTGKKLPWVPIVQMILFLFYGRSWKDVLGPTPPQTLWNITWLQRRYSDFGSHFPILFGGGGYNCKTSLWKKIITFSFRFGQQIEDFSKRRASEPVNSEYDYPKSYLSRSQVFIALKCGWWLYFVYELLTVVMSVYLN